MDVYLEFIKKSFKQRYAYRANSYLFILSSIVKLFIQVSIWFALFKNSSTINGINYADMINFVIITMIIESLVRSNIAKRLAEKVQDGSIAGDFLRPVNLKLYLISEQIGENLFYTIFNTIPVCVVGIIFLKFQLPKNFLTFMLFLFSIINGVILILYINYVLGLLSFWFKTSFYVDWLLGAFFLLFGGSMVPLWFYPKGLYGISKALPFRLVSFEPIQIYLGKVSVNQSMETIILQIIWIFILLIAEKIIWNKAQKVVTVQGG